MEEQQEVLSLTSKNLLELVIPHLNTLFVLRTVQFVCKATHSFIHCSFNDPFLWLHFCIRDFGGSSHVISLIEGEVHPSFYRIWKGIYLWQLLTATPHDL